MASDIGNVDCVRELLVNHGRMQYPCHYCVYWYQQESLACLTTNFQKSEEDQLTAYIQKKISLNLIDEKGNIAYVAIGNEVCERKLACYYCLHKNHSVITMSTSDDMESISSQKQEYVICLLSSDLMLDSFQLELQSFSENIVAQLHDSRTSSSPHTEMTVSDSVVDQLEKWIYRTVEYLARSMEYLGDGVAAILNIALMNWKLNIMGGDANANEDIQRFMDVCSLAEHIRGDSNDKQNSNSDTGLANGDTRKIVNLRWNGTSPKFDVEDCPPFCEVLAKKLQIMKNFPDQLKVMIEDFKFLVFQEINMYSRFVHEAENDYYALYKAYVFLQSSNYRSVIMQHTKAHLKSNSSATEVIHVLEDYITNSSKLKD